MRGPAIVVAKHFGWHAMPGARALVARTMAVAALVILGIGGASAATDAGPSSPAASAQPRAFGPVLADGIRAIRPAPLRIDGESRHPGAGRDWKPAIRWTGSITVPTGRRWPFRADPRRWPRLFANTTECTLSLNPIARRHWWQ